MIRFKRTLGHHKQKEYFKKIIEEENFSQAYLLSGPEGVGKATFVFELLQIYFCTEKEKPCFNCRNCKRISNFNHPDIHPILPFSIQKQFTTLVKEGDISLKRTRSSLFHRNLSIKIEQVRNLTEQIRIRAIEGNRKFFIILDADKMTRESQNAFLKTLEEPTSDTTFFLITSNSISLLPTIHSRCNMINFGSLSITDFSAYPFSRAVDINFLFKLSGGAIGRALYFLEHNFLDLKRRLLEILMKDKPPSQILRGKLSVEETHFLITVLKHIYRDFMLIKADWRDAIVHQDMMPTYIRYRDKISFWEIEKKLNEILELEDALNRNVAPVMVIMSLPRFSFV